jgi:hypothetical protein
MYILLNRDCFIMKIYNEKEFEVITQKVLSDTATNEEITQFKRIVNAWNESVENGTYRRKLTFNNSH